MIKRIKNEMNSDNYLQFEDTLINNEKDYGINQKLIKEEEYNKNRRDYAMKRPYQCSQCDTISRVAKILNNI